MVFPCINPMMVKWSPRQEHARFSALAFMGGGFGMVFIYPAIGILLKHFHWDVMSDK